MHPQDVTLNEFVEGTLAPADTAPVEAHLRECAACRQTVEDLREIRRVASTLEPIEPPAAVWGRIAGTIAEGTTASAVPSAGFALRWTWLAAAAVILIAAGAALMLRSGATRPAAGGGAPASAASQPAPSNQELAASVEAELQAAESHYQKAISGLQQIADQGKGSLDPQTAATIEKNLTVVDQAISESRAALRAQPNSEPAQQSLLESFKSKIALLQDTVALINEMRKGNDVGAAKIVSGLKQQKS
jgi:anti-sigma factor RsiW